MKRYNYLIALIFILSVGVAFTILPNNVKAASIDDQSSQGQLVGDSLLNVPSKNVDGLQIYGNSGSSYNVLPSQNISNGVFVSLYARERFTILIIAPYARVYSYNSRGVLVATNKALANNTSWAAYLGASGKYWQVATNEFIKLGDAVN